MANALNWFEIPVKDFQRAKKFYETVLGQPMYESVMGNAQMGFFPMGEDNKGVGGAITKEEGAEPCDKGTMVYLNANPDLDPMLARVEGAGGKVIVPRTMVSEEIGFIGVFIDTEGNKVALHSSK